MLNGVYGSLGTSKKDTTKSIFLPAAGSRYQTGLYGDGTDGSYWSSSLTDYPSNAWGVAFKSDRHSGFYLFGTRFYGNSVRAVCQPK